MSKHTPGPWTVRETNKSIDIRADVELITIASMSKDEIGKDKEANEAALCDARLIAAAPELLEALKRVIDSPWEPDKWRLEAEQAIAKAEGR